MNKLSQLISDGDGAPSTMRLAVLLIIVPIMTVWTVLSIKTGAMIDLDAKWLGLIAAALAAKTGQSFSENLTAKNAENAKPAGGTPALPGAALILAFSLLTSAFLCSGCRSVAPGQPSGVLSHDTNGIVYIGTWTVRTNDVYNGIKIAATIGTQQGVRADTNSITYFKLVAQVLTVALDDGQLDPVAIRTTIASLPMPDNPDVNNGIVSGLALYQAFFGQVVAQKIGDASPYLAPALTALRDGITAGLPIQPATPTP
ncbi:MAG: hypothetical protein ABSH15_04360 [Verrucomicrobiota bacterium]|jgi:hypothetical protein